MSIRAPQAIISWSWLPRSLAAQFFLTFFLRYLLNVAKINRHTAPANITPLQKLGVEGKGGRGGGEVLRQGNVTGSAQTKKS